MSKHWAWGYFFLLITNFSIATTLTRTHGAWDASIITKIYSGRLIFSVRQQAAPVATTQMKIGKHKVTVKTFVLWSLF